MTRKKLGWIVLWLGSSELGFTIGHLTRHLWVFGLAEALVALTAFWLARKIFHSTHFSFFNRRIF